MRYTIWTRRLIRVKRGYNVSYFFLSVGCGNIILLLPRTRNVIISNDELHVSLKNIYVFYASFGSFSYRGKVTIKGVSNIIVTGYSMSIFTGQYS